MTSNLLDILIIILLFINVFYIYIQFSSDIEGECDLVQELIKHINENGLKVWHLLVIVFILPIILPSIIVYRVIIKIILLNIFKTIVFILNFNITKR